MNIRQFELARDKSSHNIKALRDLYLSHGIELEDALGMAFRVADVYGSALAMTPSAFVYKTAMEQLSFYKEFHI